MPGETCQNISPTCGKSAQRIRLFDDRRIKGINQSIEAIWLGQKTGSVRDVGLTGQMTARRQNCRNVLLAPIYHPHEIKT